MTEEAGREHGRVAAAVSIAVPCYNQAHYLGECLRSLVAQTDPRWQCVVVDDCSPGEQLIRDVVEELADPRVRLIRHQVNRGLAGSRNTGIRASETDLVLCLDSDDLLDPRYLELVVPALTADDSIDAAFPDVRAFGRRNDVVRFHVPAPNEILRMQSMPGAGTLMRRRVWERVGGYDEAEILRLGREDWEFYVRAFAGPMKVVHVPVPLYCYRITGVSMTNACRVREHELAAYIHRKNKAIFDAAGAGAGEAFLSFFHHRSAIANARAGRRSQALRLAWRSFRLQPGAARAKTLLRAATPEWLFGAWRSGALRRLVPGLGYPLATGTGARPFFVLAADLEGGRRLRRALASHPGLFMPAESLDIPALIEPFRRNGRALLWPDLVRQIVGHVAFHPVSPVEGLAPLANRLLDVEQHERTLGDLIDRIARYLGECEGRFAVRWGDWLQRDRTESTSFTSKAPTPLVRVAALFPGASYVHLVRDGCDAVAGNVRGGAAAGFDRAAVHWVDDVREYRRFAAAHRGRCLEVRYERLLQAPEVELRGLCEFLGVPWEPSLPAAVTAGDDGPPSRQALDAGTRRALQEQLGPQLAALGYPPCTA